MWKNRIVGESIVDPDAVELHPLNWRRHSDKQLRTIGESLERLGWVQRVIVNKRTRHVIDGHARVALARERGEKIPVVWVNLSKEEENLALAAIDPIAAMAKADLDAYAMLCEELPELQPGDLSDLILGSSSSDSNGSNASQDDVEIVYGVLIDCRDENHQKELLKRFAEEGLECRALMF